MSSTHDEEKAQGAPMSRGITPGGHPLDVSLPAFPIYHRKIADPGPLGLAAFALTTFVLSLANASAAGVTVPNIVTGLALGYGGLCQLLAGMWEFASGNTFGATVFTSYGGFWISFGIILLPGSGIIDAYKPNNVPMLEHALGLYLFGWFIFTTVIVIASLRSSIALVALLVLLDITFLILAIGKMYYTTPAITQAGGILGVIVAFIAFYIAAATLVTPETSYFSLPLGSLAKKD